METPFFNTAHTDIQISFSVNIVTEAAKTANLNETLLNT